jgi:hypothetical protein
MGSGGLSAPTTTPNKRSPHPEASIKIVFLGKKQSNAKLNHHTEKYLRGVCFSVFCLLGLSIQSTDFNSILGVLALSQMLLGESLLDYFGAFFFSLAGCSENWFGSRLERRRTGCPVGNCCFSSSLRILDKSGF